MKTQLPEKSESIKEYLDTFKKLVTQHYGERLQYLVLYGSYARGDFREESDIDVLVVLDNMIKTEMQEISDLTDLKTDLILEHELFLSTIPVNMQKFETSNYPFYKNVRRDGIILWKK